MLLPMFQAQANLLRVLAHPKRLEIIHLLRDQELAVTEIYSMLDLPQANISQHLSILRKHKILTSRRSGKQIYYKLSDPKIITASDALRAIFLDQNSRFKLSELVPLTHDPVCEMQLSPKTASFSSKYQDQTYFFCASGCLKKFQAHPENYVKE